MAKPKSFEKGARRWLSLVPLFCLWFFWKIRGVQVKISSFTSCSLLGSSIWELSYYLKLAMMCQVLVPIHILPMSVRTLLRVSCWNKGQWISMMKESNVVNGIHWEIPWKFLTLFSSVTFPFFLCSHLLYSEWKQVEVRFSSIHTRLLLHRIFWAQKSYLRTCILRVIKLECLLNDLHAAIHYFFLENLWLIIQCLHALTEND